MVLVRFIELDSVSVIWLSEHLENTVIKDDVRFHVKHVDSLIVARIKNEEVGCVHAVCYYVIYAFLCKVYVTVDEYDIDNAI